MPSCEKSSLMSPLTTLPPKKVAHVKNQTVSKNTASVTAKESTVPPHASVSSASIIVRLKDVHKYSQVGQARTTHAKMEEPKDVSRDLLEKRDNRDWDVSANRENWEKKDPLFKIEVRDWRDPKTSQSVQIQSKNNRSLIS